MFGIKKQEKQEAIKTEGLPGPKKISGVIEKYLVNELKWDPEMLVVINMLIRKNPRSERSFDCRIFDLSEAEATGLKVKDYTSLDAHPELIAYEGWFDEVSKKVELTEKKKISFDTPIFTEKEIRQKIEAMHEPGNTIFFYQARGPAAGGPLGRGAAIIELNPDGADKKGKKYNIYTVNVIGMEPVAKKQKLFDSNKPEEIAKWVSSAHHKRLY
jgi:hypothetical protein